MLVIVLIEFIYLKSKNTRKKLKSTKWWITLRAPEHVHSDCTMHDVWTHTLEKMSIVDY